MGLEKEINNELNRVAQSTPTGLRAAVTGEPQKIDALGVLHEYVVPMLQAQRDAILRLAREVEKLT